MKLLFLKIHFAQIRSISRPCDIPDFGLMCDLLWSDPEHGVVGWAESARGISFTFGKNVVVKFCQDHNIALIVRGHQVHKIFHNDN